LRWKQPEASAGGDRLVAIVDTKLADHVAEMEIDRARHDAEFRTDLDAREPVRCHLQALPLSIAQWRSFGSSGHSLFHYTFHEQFVEVLAKKDHFAKVANDFVATRFADHRIGRV
jgi:hypothetical protein